MTAALAFWILFNQRFPGSWMSNGVLALLAALLSDVAVAVLKAKGWWP